MINTPIATSDPAAGSRSDPASSLRPVLQLGAIALPVGWLLLSIPLLLDLPFEPFVLGTLVLGMIVPAVLLTRRESGRAGVKALFRSAVQPPRPRWLLAVALLAIPVLSWLVATAVGGAQPLTGSLMATIGVQFATGLLLVNLWEEMVWTGFAQTRTMRRFGLVKGSLATAALFAGIHLPLAFADGPSSAPLGILVLFGSSIFLRLIFGCLYLAGGRGLLAIAVTHAAYNATGLLIQPGYDLIRLGVIAVLAAVALLITGRSRRFDTKEI